MIGVFCVRVTVVLSAGRSVMYWSGCGHPDERMSLAISGSHGSVLLGLV